MDAIDLLNSDEAELPKTRDIDDFYSYLDHTFQGYLSHFQELQATDYVTQEIHRNEDRIKHLCQTILKAVRHSEQGLPHLAYNEIDAGIKSVQEHFDRLCTPSNVAGSDAVNQLYRIRTINKFSTELHREHLFHIPFQLRHKVLRQRYSLPGLPCLYLGGTLYISWEEVGRPNFNSVYFSRFKLSQGSSLTFLDFGYRPALIAAMLDKISPSRDSKESSFAIAQAICWPLLAASSIKRRFSDAPFISEYIVPQLILQWINNSDKHDGIRYFSVQVDRYLDNPAMLCNYVFPSKTFAASGHCDHLMDKFELSSPISWQIAERSNMELMMPCHGGSKFSLMSGHESIYSSSPFGQMEARALALPCLKLKRPANKTK